MSSFIFFVLLEFKDQETPHFGSRLDTLMFEVPFGNLLGQGVKWTQNHKYGSSTRFCQFFHALCALNFIYISLINA